MKSFYEGQTESEQFVRRSLWCTIIIVISLIKQTSKFQLDRHKVLSLQLEKAFEDEKVHLTKATANLTEEQMIQYEKQGKALQSRIKLLSSKVEEILALFPNQVLEIPEASIYICNNCQGHINSTILTL